MHITFACGHAYFRWWSLSESKAPTHITQCALSGYRLHTTPPWKMSLPPLDLSGCPPLKVRLRALRGGITGSKETRAVCPTRRRAQKLQHRKSAIQQPLHRPPLSFSTQCALIYVSGLGRRMTWTEVLGIHSLPMLSPPGKSSKGGSGPSSSWLSSPC